jgi:hypothetical protein
MKIAFCFCGHVRTGDYAADNLIRYMGDLLPNIDFFMHTWNTNEYKGVYHNSIRVRELCKEKNCGYRNLDLRALNPYIPENTFSVIDKMQKKYKKQFKKIEVELFNENIVKKNVKPKLRPHWYSWYKVNQLKKIYEEDNNFTYDYVIKLRPDIIFSNNDSLQSDIDYCLNYKLENSIYLKDDVFYIADSKTMDIAASLMVSDLENLHRDNYFEILASMEIIPKKTKTQLFAIYRPESIPESSLNFIKCFHKAHEWYQPFNFPLPYNDQIDI